MLIVMQGFGSIVLSLLWECYLGRFWMDFIFAREAFCVLSIWQKKKTNNQKPNCLTYGPVSVGDSNTLTELVNRENYFKFVARYTHKCHILSWLMCFLQNGTSHSSYNCVIPSGPHCFRFCTMFATPIDGSWQNNRQYHPALHDVLLLLVWVQRWFRS